MEELWYSVVLRLVDFGLVSATFGVVAAANVPILQPFLKYGKTLQNNRNNIVFDVYVPKYWFVHFYILHFILSWLIFGYMMIKTHTFDNISIIMLLNVIQSTRRLYECTFVSQFSKTAQIHVFHYIVGLFFYTSINVITFAKLHLQRENALSRWMMIPISIFILVSIDQFKNHLTLSKQKKYNLPYTRLFKYVVCPHYLDEVLIYFSCYLLDPSVSYILVVVWVFVNLAVSANESFQFYKSQDQIKCQKKIIPLLY